MKTIEIQATPREILGSKEAGKLRKEGQVPCVIYGGEAPIHFSADERAFRDVVYTPDAVKVKVNLGNQSVEAVMQDIQFHPVSDKLLHIDFIQLVDGKAATMEVPVNLMGTSRGVRNGGKLKVVLRKLKVRALPGNLPSSIDIDITELRIGQSIRVGDVKPSGFEVLNSPSAVVASVKTSRTAVADEEEEGGAEGEAAAEAPAEAAAEA